MCDGDSGDESDGDQELDGVDDGDEASQFQLPTPSDTGSDSDIDDPALFSDDSSDDNEDSESVWSAAAADDDTNTTFGVGDLQSATVQEDELVERRRLKRSRSHEDDQDDRAAKRASPIRRLLDPELTRTRGCLGAINVPDYQSEEETTDAIKEEFKRMQKSYRDWRISSQVHMRTQEVGQPKLQRSDILEGISRRHTC